MQETLGHYSQLLECRHTHTHTHTKWHITWLNWFICITVCSKFFNACGVSFGSLVRWFLTTEMFRPTTCAGHAKLTEIADPSAQSMGHHPTGRALWTSCASGIAGHRTVSDGVLTVFCFNRTFVGTWWGCVCQSVCWPWPWCHHLARWHSKSWWCCSEISEAERSGGGLLPDWGGREMTALDTAWRGWHYITVHNGLHFTLRILWKVLTWHAATLTGLTDIVQGPGTAGLASGEGMHGPVKHRASGARTWTPPGWQGLKLCDQSVKTIPCRPKEFWVVIFPEACKWNSN